MRYMNRFVLSGLAVALMTMSCDMNPEQTPVLEWDSDVLTYSTDVGINIIVESDIIATEGLNTIEIELPAWSADESVETELLEITGSPRKYKFKYEVPVSEKAEIGEHKVKFNISDWVGNTLLQEVSVNIQSDTIAPVLTVTSPETEIEVMPDETVQFELLAKDELKMKDVTVSCQAAGFTQTFLPVSDPKTVEVDYEYNVGLQTGEYEFVIKATDNQLNSVEKHILVKVMQHPSKPRITRVGDNPVCGVSGGTLPFRFKVETNETCPLTKVVVKCQALSIEETVIPEGSVWSYDLSLDAEVAASTPGQRDLEYTIVAVNAKEETTEYKGYLNIFDKVYAIGKGTMAKEKEGYAIPMTQSLTDPNEFELVTWINTVGDGVKFLSEKSWNDYNWGLDTGGKIVSPDSDFIRTEATGYHKFTFNPVTWEYNVEPVTVTEEPETDKLYIYGQYNEWDTESRQWLWRDWWYREFKVHPDNPHCFYIDVKTGPEGTNVAMWKVAAQAAEGVFYGFNTPDMNVYNGELWDYHWWENIAPYYKYDSLTKVPYYREDGRKNAVMRLMVDLHLGYMSWMSLKEQVDAGWTVYPPIYTPVE